MIKSNSQVLTLKEIDQISGETNCTGVPIAMNHLG